jgi:hypothetical protein
MAMKNNDNIRLSCGRSGRGASATDSLRQEMVAAWKSALAMENVMAGVA